MDMAVGGTVGGAMGGTIGKEWIGQWMKCKEWVELWVGGAVETVSSGWILFGTLYADCVYHVTFHIVSTMLPSQP